MNLHSTAQREFGRSKCRAIAAIPVQNEAVLSGNPLTLPALHHKTRGDDRYNRLRGAKCNVLLASTPGECGYDATCCLLQLF